MRDRYSFVETENPDYILVGEFSKWTLIYPVEYVFEHYKWAQTFGDYDLYQRIEK